MAKIVNETFHKAAIKCVKNAYSLSEAAELLKENGFVSPAISLIVLACEELGKGIQYRSIAEGYTTTDVNKIGETYVFSPDILYNHKMKQLDAVAPSLIRLIDNLMQRKGEEVRKIFENVKEEDFMSGKEDPEIRKKIEALFDNDPEFREESDKLKATFDNMEILKKRGFYIDVKRGKVQTPEDLTTEEYNRLSRIFDDLASSYGDRVAGIIPGRGEEFHRKFMDGIAKRQTRPGFSRNNKKDRHKTRKN